MRKKINDLHRDFLFLKGITQGPCKVILHEFNYILPHLQMNMTIFFDKKCIKQFL